MRATNLPLGRELHHTRLPFLHHTGTGHRRCFHKGHRRGGITSWLPARVPTVIRHDRRGHAGYRGGCPTTEEPLAGHGGGFCQSQGREACELVVAVALHRTEGGAGAVDAVCVSVRVCVEEGGVM